MRGYSVMSSTFLITRALNTEFFLQRRLKLVRNRLENDPPARRLFGIVGRHAGNRAPGPGQATAAGSSHELPGKRGDESRPHEGAKYGLYAGYCLVDPLWAISSISRGGCCNYAEIQRFSKRGDYSLVD